MSEGTPPPPPPENPYGGTGQTPPPPPPPPPGQPPAYPPAGQPGGYGAPPPSGVPLGGSGAYNAPDAISYGWKKFKANPTPMVLGALILLGVVIAVSLVASGIASALFVSDPSAVMDPETGRITVSGGGGFFAGILVNMVVSLFVGLLGQILVAALIKGALDTVDGKAVSLGGMFEGWDKGAVLVAALIVAVATAIGTLLCYLPGLVVGFLTSYTMFFVVDKKMAPVEAIKASVSFVTGNLGATLLYYVLGALVVIAGAIACGVGLLVALPVAIIGAAYTFRMLHNEQVTPAV
ncbi:MAG: hypothetical protein ABIN79_09515 [Marmoricola sp.]